MIKYSKRGRIIIPEGTWKRLSDNQKAEFWDNEDGSNGETTTEVQTLKTSTQPEIKKKVAAPPVIKEDEPVIDDITGNKIDAVILDKGDNKKPIRITRKTNKGKK